MTERGAKRLPRLALLLLCAAYVVPGVFGRAPWRSADMASYGLMAAIAEGRTSWWAPLLGGVAADTAPLPHWLGAAFVAVLGPLLGGPLAARLPFALLLACTLALVWYATFHLARTEAAQPVPFAFGGEAAPVDYARAIADAALLALIATLGLLQLGHETTPELAQLCAVGGFLWSLAAAPYRRRGARAGVAASLMALSASGAPALALALGLGGALVCARSSFVQVRRQSAWVLVGVIAAIAVGWLGGTWRWRLTEGLSAADIASIARQWAWFLWPTWPAVLWALWRWRRQLTNRHVTVPLVVILASLAANLLMGGSDRALMLALPGMAMLAAFALPTLNRSTAAAIDWFSICFFSFSAVAVWVIYLAMQTGWPAKPAANVAKLAPGFESSFSLGAVLLALLATLAWLWLVRWRTGRHREAVWKSMVMPAGGVALSWLLLMTLWLPLLDYARGLGPWIDRLAPHLESADCLAAPGLGPAHVAALETQGRWRVDARPESAAGPCPLQLTLSRGAESVAPGPGWALRAEVRRPTERDEITSIWQRQSR